MAMAIVIIAMCIFVMMDFDDRRPETKHDGVRIERCFQMRVVRTIIAFAVIYEIRF